MKTATLFVFMQEFQSGHRFLSSVLIEGGKSISLVGYEFSDVSLHGQECQVEMDRGAVKKLFIGGKEYSKKQSKLSLENTSIEMDLEKSAVGEFEVSEEENVSSVPPGNDNRELFAFKCADRRVRGTQKVEKYSEQVNTIPMLIKNSGLGAALMYMRTQKTRGALVAIYEDISDWLRHDEKRLIELEDGEELAEKVINVELWQYRDITKEVLAYLAFLKRFSKGLSNL